MSTQLLILSLFVIFYTTHSFNFKKFDYCTLPKRHPECVEGADPDHGGHVVCYCRPLPSREEIWSNKTKAVISFRAEVLHLHNAFRNLVASGKEKRVSQASNMMLLNYDMELEHIARCRALGSWGRVRPAKKERCCFTSKHEVYGQSVQIHKELAFKAKKQWASRNKATKPVWWDISKIYRNVPQSSFDDMVSWYEEIGGVSQRSLDRFPTENPPAEHFTQMVWADTTHLGCVRVWNKDVSDAPWRMLLLCNYKGAGNVANRLVYKKGEGCSACPGSTKCETEKYPFLCGKLMPVPQDDVTVGGKQQKAESQRYLQNWILIIASSFFMIFVF